AAAAGLPGLVTVRQPEQRGTGHAVRCAVEAGALDDVDTVLVVPGDVPLLRSDDLRDVLAAHERSGDEVTLLTARLADPSGYGRVLRDAHQRVIGVVEHRDASDAQRRIDEICTSVYAFRRESLAAELGSLRTDNDQGEEYLTDVIAPLAERGAGAVVGDAESVAGVNDRVQLAAAGAVLRRRILERLMLDGVTVVDPATTYVGADVSVGVDTVLLPATHLEGRTRVGRGAVVGPSSRLVDAVVADGATVQASVVIEAEVGPDAVVGPFSYLRPGTRLGPRAKAGTFVEMKNTTVGAGSKVPHLSYMGDATIGEGANIGAGTITCNYDGRAKHPTVIGDGAFIGSDTMLIAPVVIGARAVTGAGSAITKDVPDDALAVERAEQRHVPGYATRHRS
ncbi:MAG TPA: bifunctional UDP-N-acetylglucosamine diphosphorylase/glucosamine-1-phosphate N-acetyltransferase GlmU, partial [Egibacteraceae bacterium]